VALATALHAISRRLWRSRWNASELWLALCSAILVATLRRIYPTCFPVLGTEGIWRPEVPLLVAAASIPAAALAAFVRPGSPRPLVIGITIGICMEIPQRLLAQNIFVVFGPGRALVGPLPLSVALTAVVRSPHRPSLGSVHRAPGSGRPQADQGRSSLRMRGVGVVLDLGGALVREDRQHSPRDGCSRFREGCSPRVPPRLQATARTSASGRGDVTRSDVRDDSHTPMSRRSNAVAAAATSATTRPASTAACAGFSPFRNGSAPM